MKWKHSGEKNHLSLLWARAALRGRSLHKAEESWAAGTLNCPWRICPCRAAFTEFLPRELHVKDVCASPTCSSVHVPSSQCLGVLPYQKPYFWSFLRCMHCHHLLSCTHAPELIPPMWANIPQRHRDHTALFKSHGFYAALNKCHDFYTYVWIAKGVVESSEQQNTEHKKLFADLWEFIQNYFFPSSAAKNLKPLGCPPMSPCFCYWSAVL